MAPTKKKGGAAAASGGRPQKRARRSSVVAAAPPTDNKDRLSIVPLEILQNIALEQLPASDGLALARTSKAMLEMLLPRFYHKDVMEHLNDGIPFALQWAAIEGYTTTFQTSVAEIKRVKGANENKILNRLTSSREINGWIGPSGLLEHRYHWLNAEQFGLAHLACWSGQIPIAKLLLEATGQVNIKDSNDQAPLCYANSKSVADFWFKRGAAINFKDESSPLNTLILRMYRVSVKSLARPNSPHLEKLHAELLATFAHLLKVGPKIDSDYWINHPLSCALKLAEGKAVKVLLDAGVDPNVHVEGSTANDAVREAFASYKVPTRSANAQLLLDRGAVISRSDLIYLVGLTVPTNFYFDFEEWPELIKRVFEHEDILNIEVHGKTAIWLAVKYGRWELVKMLVARGARWDKNGLFMLGSGISGLLEMIATYENGDKDENDKDENDKDEDDEDDDEDDDDDEDGEDEDDEDEDGEKGKNGGNGQNKNDMPSPYKQTTNRQYLDPPALLLNNPSNDAISHKPVLSAEEGDTTLKEVPADTDYAQTSTDNCHIIGFKLANHIVPGAPGLA
ncbi:hypothetical protein SCUP515_04254 [Seiridium cupressi]